MIATKQKFKLEFTCDTEDEANLIAAIVNYMGLYWIEENKVMTIEHLTQRQRDNILGALSLLQDK